MTTLHTMSRSTHRHPLLVPSATGLVACLCTALSAHDWGELVVVCAVIVAATALVHGLAVARARRRERQAGWALGLGLTAALLTLPAFWSGLPLVLGVGAVVLGNEARNREEAGGKAIAGLVLGTLATLGYLAIYVADGVVLGNGGFLVE